LVLRCRDTAAEEVGRLREVGGSAIVELSSGGLAPDPEGLAEVSRRTGIHVVMGCGHYVDEYQDRRNDTRTVDDFAAEMIAQVTEGAWGTGVKAGIIGALLAQAESGAALNVHPGRDPDQPQEIADFIRAAGHPLDRVILSHIDRTIFDSDRLLRLADTGCVIEFDLFGQENAFYKLAPIDMPNDAQRLKMIRLLIERGHLARVVISHDICYRTRLSQFGGHGYTHIFENVLPLMRERGFDESEIDAIMVGNPCRLLAFQ
jgi:phosphotriesterase-related protein